MSSPAPRYDIPTDEYQQERHVFQMCTWINDTLAKMEKTEGFDTIYFERKGTNVKKFLEEAMPIACLGLHLFKPAHDVHIQCLAGNQPYDGTLKVTGFSQLSIKVEVTTTETEISNLRRQSMSRNGYSWAAGPIEKEGRDIKSEPRMVNITKQEERWLDLAFERVLAKLKKNAYGSDTAILVNMDLWRPLSLESRAKLIRRTWLHLLEQEAEIYGVYYCYARKFIIDGVRRDDSP
jgi:hypothetical protein